MAIGMYFMKSSRPWVNRFHSPPDQAKSKKSQGNPEMQSKSCRNDGRLVYGARRRTSYSSGRRPCRHRTHWAVRAPDFLVVFFIGIFCHFDCRSATNRKALLHFSFSLEGKCHEVAKECTRVIMILILHCCSTLGQLRLTWRLYAESPQSGEISSPSSTSHIVDEISRLGVSIAPVTFIPIPACRSARDDGCRAAYRHFRR